MNNILYVLGVALLFSILDLSSGYWQVEVDLADREKAAFMVPQCLFQLCIMPFGLCNAPSTFQGVMELGVLAGLRWEICLAYINNIVIFRCTFEKCLQRLQTAMID